MWARGLTEVGAVVLGAQLQDGGTQAAMPAQDCVGQFSWWSAPAPGCRQEGARAKSFAATDAFAVSCGDARWPTD